MHLRLLLFPNKPWIFKKKIQDDYFGLMWFNRDKNPEFNHYQTHPIFKPTKKEIDIFFDADKSGITKYQKDLYLKIENNYNEIISKLIKPIQDFLTKRKSKEIIINDFYTEFNIWAISIARQENNEFDFKINFDSKAYTVSNIMVSFKNFEIIEISNKY